MPRVPETRPSLLPRGSPGYAGLPVGCAWGWRPVPTTTAVPRPNRKLPSLRMLPIFRLRFCPEPGLGRICGSSYSVKRKARTCILLVPTGLA